MYHGGGSSAQKEEEDYVTQTPSEERKEGGTPADVSINSQIPARKEGGGERKRKEGRIGGAVVKARWLDGGWGGRGEKNGRRLTSPRHRKGLKQKMEEV